MVSFYEENKVRVDRGYTFEQWRGLNPMERAIEVSLSRIEKMIDYRKNERESEMIKSNSRR
jgi:hypothetical protein